MPFNRETAKRAGAKSTRKGIKNSKTEALREKINQLLEDQWDNILMDLDVMTPKERVNVYVMLLEYAIPKLSRQEVQEVTSLEEFLKMSPDQRRDRIIELQQKLNK